jgi:hypothetical protein
LECVDRPNSHYSRRAYSTDVRILDNTFFIGKREQKLKNHHLDIIRIFGKWSEIELSKYFNKNQFQDNLIIEIFDLLKSTDPDGEALSHLKSSKRIEYVKALQAIQKLERLQKDHNQLFGSLLDIIRISISPTTSSQLRNEIMDYFVALFFKNKDYDGTERQRQLELAKNTPAILMFPMSDGENPQFYELRISEEGIEAIARLIETLTDYVVDKFTKMKDVRKEIIRELTTLKSNIGIIIRHESSIGLKGKCEIEDELSILRSTFRKIRRLFSHGR